MIINIRVFVYFEDLNKLIARITVSSDASDWPNVPVVGQLSQRSLQALQTTCTRFLPRSSTFLVLKPPSFHNIICSTILLVLRLPSFYDLFFLSKSMLERRKSTYWLCFTLIFRGHFSSGEGSTDTATTTP